MLTINYNTAALARLVAAFQCMPFWDSENRSSEFMSIYAPFLIQHRVSEALYISMYALVAEPLGEAGNRGARSRNAFVCMYYIYIRPSQLLSPRSIAQ